MRIVRFSLIALLLGLLSCSSPADKTLLNYEQSLTRADSLAKIGAADSVEAVHLLADLHREYNQVKEQSGGKRVRLMPVDGKKRFLWGTFTFLMIGLNVWLSISHIKLTSDRKHRRYLIDLSENEQRLRNNERERAELEACLEEMSLTDEEREEVSQSLIHLMEHGSRLFEENESLRTRLKEYEKHPLPRELALLEQEGERARMLDEQVQTLTATLIDSDETMQSLHNRPKFLTDAQSSYLHTLADRVYVGFSQHLAERFSQLTPADLQLCLLIRLRFTNAEIATLTAVSPASVSQQKFRLKKRMMRMEDGLFAEGETVEEIIGSC